MPFFNDIPQLPEDPILGLPIAFAADPRPHKINLGIGTYQTAEGHSFVLNSVKKAEDLIIQQHLNKDYLPIEGDATFLRDVLQLLFGKDFPLLQTDRIFAAQSVGGTSALRTGADFLVKLVSKTVYISQPSWSNHKQIFERAGLEVQYYSYLNSQTHLLDYRGMSAAIQNMPPKSVILLHGCCHNPTGLDPSPEQWKELSHLIKERQLIPLFDIAYQGFGEDLDQDAQAIRQFAIDGHEMLIAYSFSKNFGLYGERVGFLTVVCSTADQVPRVGSQIKHLIRGNYSNPPLHGMRIVSTILQSPELTLEWKQELNMMRERIQHMRQALLEALTALAPSQNFDYMHQQKGLFSFSGLNANQVQYLRQEKGIYMPDNGRINIAGLTSQNVGDVAEALVAAMRK